MILIVSIPNGNLETGVYFANLEGTFISSFSINGYTGFVDKLITPIKQRYLPGALRFGQKLENVLLIDETVSHDEKNDYVLDIDPLLLGEKYTLTVDDITYTDTAKFNSYLNGLITVCYIGNIALLGLGSDDPDTGEDYILVSVSFAGEFTTMLAFADQRTNDIEVSLKGPGYSVINPKYLPKTIATKIYVESKDAETLNDAKSYTDTKFADMVGDTAVSVQIATAIDQAIGTAIAGSY